MNKQKCNQESSSRLDKRSKSDVTKVKTNINPDIQDLFYNQKYFSEVEESE